VCGKDEGLLALFKVEVCKNKQLVRKVIIHHQPFEAWKPYRVKVN